MSSHFAKERMTPKYSICEIYIFLHFDTTTFNNNFIETYVWKSLNAVVFSISGKEYLSVVTNRSVTNIENLTKICGQDRFMFVSCALNVKRP
jgi:hypothetical protein